MTLELDRYLPTIEKARAQGINLPSAAPLSEKRLAAVVVMARAVRRDLWDEVRAAIDADPPVPHGDAPPPSDYTTRMHVRFIGPARRGFRIRHYTDTALSICDMHVPTLPEPFAYESALEELSVLGATPPDCLRCHDLAPRTAGESAYRGGGKLVTPDFHGYSFGDAIDKAKVAIDRMGVRGSVFLLQVAAWAWPFLWLHYPRHVAGVSNIVLAPNAGGRLSAIEDLGAPVASAPAVPTG